MPLITGGSAVAMPLPALYLRSGQLAADAETAVGPALPEGAVVLSGSASAMTNRQVAAYARHAPSFQLDPLALAKEGYSAAIDWLNKQPQNANPMIYATAAPDAVRAAQQQLGVAKAGEIVERALAALAVAARDKGIRRFVVAGGETSGAVTKALGVTRLDIGAEIAPGVPWTFCNSGGHDIALSLKSGNFGAESFFTDALEAL